MSEKLVGAPTVSGRRILVIDDDVDFAQGLGAVLEDAGHEVRVAFSASESLTLLANFTPHVAIADLHMSIVDGYALLAIFRADANLSECTFVGISGDAQQVTRAAEAFDHFFVKPLDMRLLVEVLDNGIASRRLH